MSIRRAQDERIEGTPDGLNAISEIMDVPDAPTIGTATANALSASVTFTPATTGGTATTYTVTSTPSSITGTGASSPITVSGLADGTAYTFKVKGTNATGVVGPESSASNSITAAAPLEGAYDALGSFRLTSTASTITFTNIPSGYRHLQIRFSATLGASANIRHRVNNDSGSNYDSHELVSYGTSGPNASPAINDSNPIFSVGQATYPVIGIADFLDYASTNKYKVWRVFTGTESNTVGLTRLYFKSISWRSTEPITSIVLTAESTTFSINSIFALYGVK